MQVKEFLDLLDSDPTAVSFEQVMQIIEDNFDYTPTRFTNGKGKDRVINEAGQNEGSCKIFAFADRLDLNEAQTLALFGKYYREDVLGNLTGTDHANIRTFMRYGWPGIEFDGEALQDKQA